MTAALFPPIRTFAIRAFPTFKGYPNRNAAPFFFLLFPSQVPSYVPPRVDVQEAALAYQVSFPPSLRIEAPAAQGEVRRDFLLISRSPSSFPGISEVRSPALLHCSFSWSRSSFRRRRSSLIEVGSVLDCTDVKALFSFFPQARSTSPFPEIIRRRFFHLPSLSRFFSTLTLLPFLAISFRLGSSDGRKLIRSL